MSQLNDESGFTLVELIVVVMMIGILSSIAIPQFMTAADKAKQKEATGIIAALVKAATAYQTEYGALPTNAEQISEYAKFQECTHASKLTLGGQVCKGTMPAQLPNTATSFVTSSGNYLVEFEINDVAGDTIFQARANPNGQAYASNGSAVIGCFNPVDSVSEIYEYTAKAADKGNGKPYRPC
ncbi:type II secretion system protein [Prochlorococcus sp. MIT 1307]|uniref:type II secretion system protein n=1 Tax=Prochlorococcus sp. MIT 1307 TaxID=3096219 RepID=UPI002A752644|nr:prepilin-type N-terminal cleavage/methylation domain-containing protein [Prochlorococcus sp. MIT 1307]